MKVSNRSRLFLFGVACLAIAPLPARLAAQTKGPTPNLVELKASDGVPLAGFWLDMRDDTGGPAVLLLHNVGRDHFAWKTLWPGLQKVGCSFLALDLRGHGASRRLAPGPYDQLVARDPSVYQAMVLDVEAGLEFLQRQRGIRAEDIVVIGGELGCSLGFAVMARNPKLRGMAALSPSLNDYGFHVLDLVPKYGKRPLLIVTTKKRLPEGPQAIHDALAGKAKVRLEVWPGADVKGVQMLGQPANIERLIVEWLTSL
jgi:pimeloyl-ACP methyl ester carboxylesterase